MPNTITKTVSPKPETPFPAKVPWKWNEIPTAGTPIRTRCQRIANDAERKAGAKIIATYREWETISEANNIEGRQGELTRLKGIPAELMKREISACDYDKWVQAQEKLRELREESFLLIVPIFRRLIESLDGELNESALASEQRLDRAGIPIKHGAEWALHGDMLCCALWSQRWIVEKTFASFKEHRDGIGACQFFLTDEASVPFNWV